jgi:hypothetical protein
MSGLSMFVVLKHVIYYLIAKLIDICYSLILLVNPICLEGTVLSLTHTHTHTHFEVCMCVYIYIVMVSDFYGVPNLHDVHWLFVCGITCFVIPSVFHLTLK